MHTSTGSHESEPICTTPRSLLWRGGGICVLLLAAFGCFWFLRRDAAGCLGFDRAYYTNYYWPRRHEVLLHVSAGAVALCTGLIQIYLGLTGRTRRLHRWLGRIYLIGVAAGVVAAGLLVSQIPISLYSLGLVGLAGSWVTTTLIAYLAVRRGNLALHRAWMIRSYIVTFAFVTLRVL